VDKVASASASSLQSALAQVTAPNTSAEKHFPSRLQKLAPGLLLHLTEMWDLAHQERSSFASSCDAFLRGWQSAQLLLEV